jgi:hypothetical protein
MLSGMPHADLDLVVFDVLGTLVDEPGGLRAAIRDIAPPGAEIDDLADAWLDHVADQQRKMLDGRRPYATSDMVDREAAELVAARCGATGSPPPDDASTPGPTPSDRSTGSRTTSRSSACPTRAEPPSPASAPTPACAGTACSQRRTRAATSPRRRSTGSPSTSPAAHPTGS